MEIVEIAPGIYECRDAAKLASAVMEIAKSKGEFKELEEWINAQLKN